MVRLPCSLPPTPSDGVEAVVGKVALVGQVSTASTTP